MSKEEILESNKLIAEFMGGLFKSNKFTINDGWVWLPFENMCKITSLRYNSSWDWLMPVIEKIESFGYRWEVGMSTTSPYHYCKIWSIGSIEGISSSDAIYGAVIKFIKWYNQNKSNETN